MKWQRLIALALAVAAAPVTGVTATPTPLAPEAPPATTPEADSLSRLSPPVLGLVKMLNSGVSQDVVNAYVQTSPTPFNLTAEDIIRLQGLGVSTSLTTAMLNHDKALRDNPRLAGAPAPGTQGPAVTAPLTPSDNEVYNNLAPYGSWGDLPGYGPYWQPYGTLAYDYYPWPWLSFGFWWNFPGRGWCWFPHSHFRNFNHFHGARGSFAFNHFIGTRTTTAFGRGTGTRAFSSSGTFRTGTAGFGGITRVQNSPWVSSFSGGFHGSTARTGGSGTFRGGTGGGFHTGTGGGGFHGGFHGGGGGFHGGGRR